MHASCSLRFLTVGKKEGGERGEEKGEEEEEEGGQGKESRMMQVVRDRTGERFYVGPRGDRST